MKCESMNHAKRRPGRRALYLSFSSARALNPIQNRFFFIQKINVRLSVIRTAYQIWGAYLHIAPIQSSKEGNAAPAYKAKCAGKQKERKDLVDVHR